MRSLYPDGRTNFDVDALNELDASDIDRIASLQIRSAPAVNAALLIVRDHVVRVIERGAFGDPVTHSQVVRQIADSHVPIDIEEMFAEAYGLKSYAEDIDEYGPFATLLEALRTALQITYRDIIYALLGYAADAYDAQDGPDLEHPNGYWEAGDY